MESKIEVRRFAIDKAIEIMGTGTPDKDVVTKAREIETYIIGDAELPELSDPAKTMSGMFASFLKGIESLYPNLSNTPPDLGTDDMSKDEKTE